MPSICSVNVANPDTSLLMMLRYRPISVDDAISISTPSATGYRFDSSDEHAISPGFRLSSNCHVPGSVWEFPRSQLGTFATMITNFTIGASEKPLVYFRKRPELRQSLRIQIENEFGRSEGRIAVLRPQAARHRKRFGGVAFGNLRQERIDGDRLDIEPGENLFREIGKVVGDDVPRAAPDRRRQDVAVVRVGKIERPDQRLVSDNQSVVEMLGHGSSLRTDAPFQMRLPIEQAPRPFVENSLGPPGLEQAGMVEAQQDVPHSEGKQDVRIKDGDRTIRDGRQDASNSCPRRASSSSAALRAASRRSL